MAQSRQVAWRHEHDAAPAKEFYLERHHVLWLRSLDRFHRDRVIECDKSPAVPNRKCKQVEIRQLARPVNARGIDPFLVDQADVIRPKLVEATRTRLCKAFDDRTHGQRIWIPLMGHDAHTPILGDWT